MKTLSIVLLGLLISFVQFAAFAYVMRNTHTAVQNYVHAIVFSADARLVAGGVQ